MRPFRDRPDITVPGRWYFCPPGAKKLPFAHCFWPSVWDEQTDGKNPIGEVRRKFVKPIKSDPPPRATGQHWCGSEELWQQGALYEQRNTLRMAPDGKPFCCSEEVPEGGGEVEGGYSPQGLGKAQEPEPVGAEIEGNVGTQYLKDDYLRAVVELAATERIGDQDALDLASELEGVETIAEELGFDVLVDLPSTEETADSSTLDVLTELEGVEAIAEEPGFDVLVDLPSTEETADSSTLDVLTELEGVEAVADGPGFDVLVDLPSTEGAEETGPLDLVTELEGTEAGTDAGTLDVVVELESVETFS